MSRKQLAFAAVAAVAALVLSACGSSDEAAPPAEAPPATTAPASTTAPEATTEQTTEQAPGPEAVVIRIENGQPVGGTKTVTVKHGDEVLLRVEVDAPQELHLHGYDIEQEAAPGEPAVFQFSADLEGIFDLESHLDDAKVVKLVVNP